VSGTGLALKPAALQNFQLRDRSNSSSPNITGAMRHSLAAVAWSTVLRIRLGKFGAFGSQHLKAMGKGSMEKKSQPRSVEGRSLLFWRKDLE
jgi:hypothetical protein